jgi:hypothetical protein
MSARRIAVSMILGASLSIGAALAQTSDLEPGVQTSAPAPAPAAAPAPVKVPAAAAVPAPAVAAPPAAAAAPAAKTAASKDRIQLDTTQISGNRELPKVMYVVPWRKADLGEFAGKPPNSLLDEALTPVDREVFRRQNRYYSALQGGATDVKSQPGAAGPQGGGPAPKDEK